MAAVDIVPGKHSLDLVLRNIKDKKEKTEAIEQSKGMDGTEETLIFQPSVSFRFHKVTSD